MRFELAITFGKGSDWGMGHRHDNSGRHDGHQVRNTKLQVHVCGGGYVLTFVIRSILIILSLPCALVPRRSIPCIYCLPQRNTPLEEEVSTSHAYSVLRQKETTACPRKPLESHKQKHRKKTGRSEVSMHCQVGSKSESIHHSMQRTSPSPPSRYHILFLLSFSHWRTQNTIDHS